MRLSSFSVRAIVNAPNEKIAPSGILSGGALSSVWRGYILQSLDWLSDDFDESGKQQLQEYAAYLISGETMTTTRDYVRLSHRLSSGQHGGTALSGGWYIRPINTIESDNSSIVTLSQNQFALPSGTYEAHIVSTHQGNVGQVQSRLVRSGTNDVVLQANNSRMASNILASVNSVIEGQFNLTTQTVLELQYRVTSTVSLFGLGVACGFGNDETYATITLFRST